MAPMKPLAALLLAASASLAAAQDPFPAKPVRIVTSTAGNFHDVVARRMAQSLAARWKQPVVVENRGGVGMIIATTAVAQAPADGYTLLLTDRSALAVQPNLQARLPYDPLKDLTPITLVGAAPLLLLVDPALPARTLAEFMQALAAATPPMTFGSAGPGTATHLAGEVLGQAAGASVLNVHYKGAPAAMTGLLGREVKAAFMLIPVGLPHVRSGRVRALAITAKERFPGVPDVPTAAEAGVPAIEGELWLALMAPAHLPQKTLAVIRRDVSEVLADPAFRDTLLAQGATVAQSTPEELAALIRDETARWKKVIQTAGIKAN